MIMDEFPPIAPADDYAAQPRPLMTTDEACERLQVSYRVLRSLARQGLVSGFKLSNSARGRWRWMRASVERFARGEVGAAPATTDRARGGAR